MPVRSDRPCVSHSYHPDHLCARAADLACVCDWIDVSLFVSLSTSVTEYEFSILLLKLSTCICLRRCARKDTECLHCRLIDGKSQIYLIMSLLDKRSFNVASLVLMFSH